MAVSQNCCAGKSTQFIESFSQIFDDDLLLAHKFIDHEASLAAVVFDNDHEGTAWIGGVGLDVPHFVEAYEGDQISPYSDQFATLGHARQVFGFGADGFFDGYGGDDVLLFPDTDDHAVDNGEGEGEGDGYGGSLAWLRCDVDVSAEFLDVAFDDVHSDAAPGDVGDNLGGG